MSFQNSLNSIFYEEQHRWMEEVVAQKKQFFIFEPSVHKIKLCNKKQGLLYFNLKITRPSGRVKDYSVVYRIVKDSSHSKWILDDYPFLNVKSQNIDVKYFKDVHDQALLAINYGNRIIDNYNKLFKWNPNQVKIKIFSTLDQISTSIPCFTTYGWSEEKESIKILVPHYTKEKTKIFLQMLTHELSHKMLSNITNDNASLWLQEGLAVLLEKSFIFKGNSINFSASNSENYVKKVLKDVGYTLLSLSELNKLDYRSGHEIYNQGFLLVYFLFSKYGLQKLDNIFKNLKEFNYINSRTQCKLKKLNARTNMALVQNLDNYDDLHNQLKTFYLKYT